LQAISPDFIFCRGSEIPTWAICFIHRQLFSTRVLRPFATERGNSESLPGSKMVRLPLALPCARSFDRTLERRCDWPTILFKPDQNREAEFQENWLGDQFAVHITIRSLYRFAYRQIQALIPSSPPGNGPRIPMNFSKGLASERAGLITVRPSACHKLNPGRRVPSRAVYESLAER